METLLRVGLGNAVVAGLMALGAASVGVFARRRPALRHGLWLLVLLKLVTPPLWSVPVAWFARPVEAGAETSGVHPPAGILERAEDAPELELSPRADGPEIAGEARGASPTVTVEPLAPDGLSWSGWVLAAWGGGSLFMAGVAARRIGRFQGLLRLAEPASERTKEQVEALADRLGLARAPGVWSVPGAVSPMLWALGCRPRLIVPTELWGRLDERQRDTLLTHELAHLKRRDHWVRCLELLVTGLYWWLPLVWIARHALREAEEQCCDAWVVWAFPDASRTYAEALLETVDFLSGVEPAVPLAASGLGQVDHLKRRMMMIMQGTTPRGLTWSGLLAVLGLSATLLPLSPTWAQQGPDLEERFYQSLQKAHEFDDPQWPFLIKVKDVQDKTLIDATFKHRAGTPENPDSFDMIVHARKATVQFDTNDGVARVQLDGAEVTGPREDVSLINNTILEIPISSAIDVLNDEDEETVASTPAKTRRSRIVEKKEPTVFTYSRPEAELLRAEAGADDEQGKPKPRARKVEPRPTPPAQESEDVEIESKGDDRAPAKQKAEIARLKAEVEERRAALVEAEKRLAEAIRTMVGAGKAYGVYTPTHTRTFVLRGNKSGQEPFKPGVVRIVPRPDHDVVYFNEPGQAPFKPGVVQFVPRPDQEKRMAELEEKLEKLQDEVKTLKKDAPARR